jgi:DtxR family Mn-dependent transcriptional regulator
MEPQLTRSQRTALKEIWRRADEPGEPARTGDIASALGVSPATATALVKRLVAQGLATHAPYKGVSLTPGGRRVAAAVVRRHRVVERFLADYLGYRWAEADALAPRFEHDIPQEVEDRLYEALGRPASCPHGFPIPSLGSDAVPYVAQLYELEPGQRAIVALSSSVSPAMLAFLGEMGFVPGALVEVLDKQPFGGPLLVRVAGSERALGESAGRQVRVRMLAPSPNTNKEPGGDATATPETAPAAEPAGA